ncbi:MAG: hypothetical protein ACUVQM_01675, partial [Candidatus Hadarchaeaceae archaeon]
NMIVRQGLKPAEVVEPEPTGNGDPCKNPGEKPGKDAGKSRGGTRRDSDCRKKIPTRKDGELTKWSRFVNSLDK